MVSTESRATDDFELLQAAHIAVEGFKVGETDHKLYKASIEALKESGYKLHSSYKPSSGYAGLAFVNERTKEVLIVNGPTVAAKDFYPTNFQLGMGIIPSQFTKGLKVFADKLMGEFDREYKFTVTGFSLGAALTDLGTTYLHHKGRDVVGLGVDNPGTKGIVEKLEKKLAKEGHHVAMPAKISNYIIDVPHLFNTVHPQTGEVRVLRSDFTKRETERESSIPKEQSFFERIGTDLNLVAMGRCISKRFRQLPSHIKALEGFPILVPQSVGEEGMQRDFLERNQRITKALLMCATVLMSLPILIGGIVQKISEIRNNDIVYDKEPKLAEAVVAAVGESEGRGP